MAKPSTSASERDMKIKLKMHCKFCSDPPKSFKKIRNPKKAITLREHQLNEAENFRRIYH